jgi:hypothetical protein
MLRVSSVRVARLTRLGARRVRLGNLGSRMGRCARRDNLASRRALYTRRDNQGSQDRRASRDNAANQDKPASRANRDKPVSRDNVVSLVSPMDWCEHRGNRPVRLALRDSRPLNRVRPNRQRPRSRSAPTQLTKKRRASATNRRPAQFRLDKRPSRYSAAFFKGRDYRAAVCTTGKSTKLTAEPPSNILMVAFL